MNQMSDSRFGALACLGGALVYGALLYFKLVPGAKTFVLQYDGAVLGILLAAALVFWLCSIDFSELDEEERSTIEPQTKTPPDD